MKTEIERKYRIADLAETREKIISEGGAPKGSSRTVDTYFVVPQEKPNTRYLRLRQKGDEQAMTLAYHEVPDNDVTLEWETPVQSGSVAHEIIEKLGFPVDVAVDKKREVFTLEESEIVLDQVEPLGAFVEIESPDLETLLSIVARLDIDESTRVAGLGYPDLVRDSIATR